MGRLPSARRRRPGRADRRRPGSRTTSRGRGGSRTRDRRPTWAAPSAAGGARKPEEAGRHAGGALQQIGALELRCVRQRRLEELAHHSEGELALQLGSPRPEHAHSARLPLRSAPPRAAPSCRSRPAPRSPRTCRAPRGLRPAPTRSAPAPRSVRAADRWPCSSSASSATASALMGRALGAVTEKSGGSPRCERGPPSSIVGTTRPRAPGRQH